MANFKSLILLRKINKFEKAAIDRSWMGITPPEDHGEIEKEYNKARLALIDYVIQHVM